MRWREGQGSEVEPEAFVMDGESLGLNEELEFKVDEPAENEETQTRRDVEPPALEVGKVKTVGVAIYSDSSVSDSLYSVDWGSLEPGAEKNVDCYIQNTGGFASVLSLETDNWGPAEAANYISLSWDYDGQVLDVGEVIPVTLILTVSEDIEGISSFFFDITIIGSGV